MKKKNNFILALFLVCSVIMFCLSSCGISPLISLHESIKMKNYYSEKGNYINASGTITELEYSQNGKALILVFDEDIAPANIFTSRKFVIEEENLLVIKMNGFDEKVEIGSFVEFTTVPSALFGYARPIVSLTINGETLLDFEDGYQGLLDAL